MYTDIQYISLFMFVVVQDLDTAWFGQGMRANA